LLQIMHILHTLHGISNSLPIYIEAGFGAAFMT